MMKFETHIDISLRRTILSRKISSSKLHMIDYSLLKILSSRTLRTMVTKFGEIIP
jgi:hypothetical protein